MSRFLIKSSTVNLMKRIGTTTKNSTPQFTMPSILPFSQMVVAFLVELVPALTATVLTATWMKANARRFWRFLFPKAKVRKQQSQPSCVLPSSKCVVPSTRRTPKIGYQAFARFVLMSFVAARRRAIEPIVSALHQIDPDRNGVFDHAQLRSVMDKVVPGSTPREQHYVTQVLDPVGHQVILFSDIVKELCGLTPAEAGTGTMPMTDNQRRQILDKFKQRVKLDDD
jgi:hypothetical protein